MCNMNNDIQYFLEEYCGVTFPHSDSLFSLIERKEVLKVLRYPGGQPSSDLAQIYKERAIMANKGSPYSDPKKFSMFTDLVVGLNEYPTELCKLWVFQSNTASYSVFELENIKLIAGCIKAGPLLKQDSES